RARRLSRQVSRPRRLAHGDHSWRGDFLRVVVLRAVPADPRRRAGLQRKHLHLFQIGPINASVGFLVDRLTAMMLVVVSFVSLLVHVYTIGYMADDDGYTRFFIYISLFTFSMFMLVMSNNFMQLFFGWEAVGLVSYLLIG